MSGHPQSGAPRYVAHPSPAATGAPPAPLARERQKHSVAAVLTDQARCAPAPQHAAVQVGQKLQLDVPWQAGALLLRLGEEVIQVLCHHLIEHPVLGLPLPAPLGSGFVHGPRLRKAHAGRPRPAAALLGPAACLWAIARRMASRPRGPPSAGRTAAGCRIPRAPSKPRPRQMLSP